MGNKIGRNDPCPCGSGIKCKRCCWDDIHRTVFIDKKALKKMPRENWKMLMDDLETDKYEKEYINERTSIQHE